LNLELDNRKRFEYILSAERAEGALSGLRADFKIKLTFLTIIS
jgi:hypothetical protein